MDLLWIRHYEYRYMESVQSAARMDLNEVVKEKVEKCRDLEDKVSGA